MRLEILPDEEAMSRRAAEIIACAIREKPQLVLGLATGGTPLGTYRELVRLYREGRVDFARVTTFNLDEYVGLPPGDPRSYHAYMQEHLFRHVNLRPEATHLPDGWAEDLEAECRRYEALIEAAGGIDLQLLGIGRDGHIGFNEPGARWEQGTRVVRLKPETRQDNARYFGGVVEAVPERAISMGVRTIMHARRLLLLAAGRHKAEIVRRAVEGPVSRHVPASILQLHPDALVLLDESAASQLTRARALAARREEAGG
ncbi:MAG: glucosamine-6-phosphate deaminase [Firmicutes bacterium]|nr:glucosamine-6-phosphate deaminase [Bacillota bacterium]